jgi:hypothetical protein
MDDTAGKGRLHGQHPPFDPDPIRPSWDELFAASVGLPNDGLQHDAGVAFTQSGGHSQQTPLYGASLLSGHHYMHPELDALEFFEYPLWGNSTTESTALLGSNAIEAAGSEMRDAQDMDAWLESLRPSAVSGAGPHPEWNQSDPPDSVLQNNDIQSTYSAAIRPDTPSAPRLHPLESAVPCDSTSTAPSLLISTTPR